MFFVRINIYEGQMEHEKFISKELKLNRKHIKMKKITLFLLLSVSLTIVAQSPWTQKKNKFYAELSFSTISGYSELSGTPDYNTERLIDDNTVKIYAEYGLSDKTSLIANIPFKMVAAGDLVEPTNAFPLTAESTLNGLGNVLLGVKHNFFNDKWLLSGQINAEVNTGDFEEVSGLRTGLDSFTVTPLLIAGAGFKRSYLQGFTGFDIRGNGYSSAYKLGGEFGYRALNFLWVAAFLDGVASFNNGDVVIPTSNVLTGLYVNNQNYAAFGLKFIGEINKNIGVNLGMGGAFAAKNAAKQPSLSLGLYYKN